MTGRGRLEGRRILVTGAAAGIGRACAQRCLEEGAEVALTDVDATALTRTGIELAAIGPATVAALDVANRETVAARVAEVVHALGGLDGLVNNAGVAIHHELETLDWEDWDRTLAVNLTGAMQVCQAALPALRASAGAAIVNVASGAGLRPIPRSLAYCASKAGLIMASRALAEELGPDGIRVNAVCPGPTDTAMFRDSFGGARSADEVRARNALRRIGETREIAPAVAFLLSDEASFVTGAALAIEGGRVFH